MIWKLYNFIISSNLNSIKVENDVALQACIYKPYQLSRVCSWTPLGDLPFHI